MESVKKTRIIHIGGKENVRSCFLGGDMPILVQTMWKQPLYRDRLQEIVREIENLEQLGCDILRFAVPDKESADAFVQLSRMTTMPLVADIHFNHELALRCMDGPVAKIRINPGNIGNNQRVLAVINKARATDTPIRIGVNSGSIPTDLRLKMEKESTEHEYPQQARAQALVEAAFREIAFFDKHNFDKIIVSMKASSVKETILANELFAARSSIPLHLGVTEAGPLIPGIVKSTLAFSQLLAHNIGATIRVSLSDSMENEIIAAQTILTECGKRKEGIQLISCPRCGRNGFDVHGFIQRWQNKLFTEKKTITVAVMGCEVNGPGESRHADIGITGSEHSVLLFKHGQIIQRIDLKNLSQAEKNILIDTAFEKELASL